ncbi:unnamed protein product [Calypogeia fissa]
MAEPEKVPLLGIISKKIGKNDNPWVSVFNLCNAAIGAGVLSFPYGFRQTGVLGGLFFTSFIWIVEVLALCILVRVAEKHNSQSYQQMVLSVLGSRMALVTSVTMLIFLTGGMISYLIITGDVFTPLFAEKFGENSILGNRRVVMALLALLVILPLSLQATLKALKYSSMISVFMLTYLTLALISIGVFQIVKDGFPTDVLIFQAGMRAFIILDIVVFAFQCHIQVVPIFAELAEHPHPFFKRDKDPLEEEVLDEEIISEMLVEGNRSERVKRMDGVIFVSMSICFIGYVLVGEFGYLIFRDVESDVLKSFGNTNFFMNIARIGMAVVAMVCYPLQHHPARLIIDDAVKYVAKVSESGFSWTRHILITLGFFSFTLGVALLITDLGKVFSIVGSTGGVMVVFIIPGILLLLGSHNSSPAVSDLPIVEAEPALTRSTRSRSQACIEVLGGTCMVVFGFIIFGSTVYVTIVGL